jgi:signal transduction histidine kinase
MQQPEDIQPQAQSSADRFGIGPAIVAAAIVVCLFAVGYYSYLFFHTLIELFSIIVACGIFILAWNTRRFVHNGYFLFLGIAYLFTAFFDLLHLLAYKGMPIFPTYTSNLPTQLWIVQRYILGLGFLVAPLMLGRRLRTTTVFITFATATLLLLVSIFYWRNFPECFVEGTSLTAFKTVSEYIIAAIFAASGIVLYAKRKEFDTHVLSLLLTSAALNVTTELCFTLYIDPYGVSNFVGHIFDIVAYYLVYKAIIETGLVRPYDLLFRNLRLHQNHLEEMVQARTAELQNMNTQLEQEKLRLRSLASELSLAEERQRREIATGLHDHLGQLLAMSKMKLGAMRKNTTSTPDDISTLYQLIEQSIEYTRTLTFELSPPVLYTFGLEAAVEWLTEQFEGRHNIQVFFNDDGQSKPLANDVRVVLFQAVRELLFNVAKHAKAEHVTVSLSRGASGISVYVEDDGVGFNPSNVSGGKGGGFGLFNIRERLDYVGGALEIESVIPHGTRIIITAPLSK